MSSPDPADARERRELTQLLWFFWVGIVLAVIGEAVLVFLMKSMAADNAAGWANTSTLVVGGLAVTMWGLSAFIYRKRLGGGGMSTALMCWMLAKGTAILAFVMYFLVPDWGYTAILMSGFLVSMGLLQPPNFLDGHAAASTS